jgi:hypothetical protein
MARATHLFVSALALVSLSACGRDGDKQEAAAIDDTVLGKGNATDPAITSALEDQIMVDPALANQSNAHAVRPADRPAQAPIPTEAVGGPAPVDTRTTLGQRVAARAAAAPAAATQVAVPPVQNSNAGPRTMPGAAYSNPPATQTSAALAADAFSGCGLDVRYSMTWSNRLPADLPLYPQARVAEAAGSDQGVCRLRAVTFSTSAAPRVLIDYYIATAKSAGYQAQYTTKGGEQMVVGQREDGAAFYILISPRQSGGAVADLVANRGI